MVWKDRRLTLSKPSFIKKVIKIMIKNTFTLLLTSSSPKVFHTNVKTFQSLTVYLRKEISFLSWLVKLFVSICTAHSKSDRICVTNCRVYTHSSRYLVYVVNLTYLIYLHWLIVDGVCNCILESDTDANQKVVAKICLNDHSSCFQLVENVSILKIF